MYNIICLKKIQFYVKSEVLTTVSSLCVMSNLKPLSLVANKRRMHRVYVLCLRGVCLVVTDKKKRDDVAQSPV